LLAQRKRIKRKGSLSLDPQYADFLALLVKSGRFGKSLALRRIVFTALCCAAQLREMAFNRYIMLQLA
jgi:hypothetical protein